MSRIANKKSLALKKNIDDSDDDINNDIPMTKYSIVNIAKHNPKTESEVRSVVKKLYPNNNIAEIVEDYTKKYNKALNYARKFYIALVHKGYNTLPPKKLIQLAQKYQAKYKFSDEIFTLFLSIYKDKERIKIGKYNNTYDTPMSKFFGINASLSSGLTISDKDRIILTDIEQLTRETRDLSKNVKYQSFTYRTLSSLMTALNGTFDPRYDKQYNFISPVIAALFIPIIKIFEERIIFADIGQLVCSINEEHNVPDGPSSNLLNDLIRDPAQNDDPQISPIKDILMRTRIQACMWEIISNLRTGRYFDSKFQSKLNELLDQYPQNMFDALDMNISDDAGVWLRKLMNVFSIRPTVISRSKVLSPAGIFLSHHDIGSKLYNENIIDLTDTVDGEITNKIDTIPMIHIRIPPTTMINADNIIKNIRITANLDTLQWFHTSSAPKIYSQRIISSNNVIIFYINRQYSSINRVTHYNPFSELTINYLPSSLSNASKVNTYPVDFDSTIIVGTTVYELRSIVCCETLNIENSVISKGTSAIINLPNQNGEIMHLYYNPSRSFEKIENQYIQPVTILPDIMYQENEGENYETKARLYGNVFIYTNNAENPQFQ